MQLEFSVNQRHNKGTGASRRLRRSGKTPGIVYGTKTTPMQIEIDHNTIFHALLKEEFHSSILSLNIDGNVEKVLLRDYQMHPYKRQVVHIDFQRIDQNTFITVKVPLHFSGEEISPAVKTGGGLVSHVQNDIEIRCLPVNLPKFIACDLSKLENGQSIHAKDLSLPEGVSLSVSAEHDNSVLVVVSATKDDSAE